jgi:diaminohydroxyphosphoribosylaminopyrimidine deaminase/5-amino-6-(5-phosphoribosylamino)uracil reductase
MEDGQYMTIALEAARKGIGSVEPNPAVGCVIVKEGAIVATGWHERFGGPHAEVNALADCRGKGVDPTGSTMYVTLEPCCHFGKTGPCTEAIIAAGISRVVVAVEDPSRHVAGNGIKRLKEAGIFVETGLCREQAFFLNAPFFKHAATSRPWVIAKWAQSADGYLARSNGGWISNEQSRADVHRFRRRCQGILVGIDTVIADDPMLNVRQEGSVWDRQPVRVVLDCALRIPPDRKVLDVSTSSTVIVITSETFRDKAKRVNEIAETGAEVLAVQSRAGRCNLPDVLDQLGRRGIQQLLVEGGRKVLTSFIREGLVDEVRVYVSGEKLGETGRIKITDEMAGAAGSGKLVNVCEESFGEDRCISGFTHPVQGSFS